MSLRTFIICDGCNEQFESESGYAPDQWRSIEVVTRGKLGSAKQYDVCPDCYLRIVDVVR